MIKPLLGFLLAFSTLAAEAQLQFIPNEPVVYHSNIKIRSKFSNGGKETELFETQKSDVVYTIIGEQPQYRLPLNVDYVLKKMAIQFKTDKELLSIDTDNPGTSKDIAQISKLINKHITFNIEKDDQVNIIDNYFNKVYGDMAVLEKFQIKNLFTHPFRETLILIGKDLKVGSHFEKDFPATKDSPYPVTYSITVTDITDNQIKANTEVKIKRMRVKQKNSTVTLTGGWKGEVSWNRDQALLYNSKGIGAVGFSIKKDQNHTVMTLDIVHQETSEKAS